MLKLVLDVLEFLAPKRLLGSKTAMNEVLVQELLASSNSDGRVFGSESLGHFLSNKSRDCIKGLWHMPS